MITRAVLKVLEVVGILVLLFGIIIMVIYYEVKDLLTGKTFPSKDEYHSA